MFDGDLALTILVQVDEAIQKLLYRSAQAEGPDYFTNTPEGMERLDGIAMLFIAIGESLKNLDKISDGTLLSKHSEIDWAGVKGFRDIIAHQELQL
jgi:uncharacterized protein with HEPN domain